jgi:two-component system, chemotaxis family, protein-glutamate methylesterase/glutaminase
MKTINIFVAEPSSYVRDQLKTAINKTDDFHLISSSDTVHADQIGKEIIESEPDLLLLGIDHIDSEEMKLFYRIREQLAYLPIIVLVPHNKFGAVAAIEAVKNGAVEYFPKTTTFVDRVRTLDFFLNRVVPVMKATRKLNRTVLITPDYMDKKLKSTDPVPADFFKTAMSRLELLIIAGCLGGIASLYILLSKLPANLPVPIIILQHIEEVFSEVLADDLNRYTQLEVKEAKDGSALQNGVAYLAPGNFHIQVKKSDGVGSITLNQQSDVAGFRPSIDVLLDSVSKQYGANTLTVFLSGGGGDGIQGAKVIDIIGGQIIVQNKQSSLLSDFNWKMHVHGIHEGSYPIERLAHEIAARLR